MGIYKSTNHTTFASCTGRGTMIYEFVQFVNCISLERLSGYIQVNDPYDFYELYGS